MAELNEQDSLLLQNSIKYLHDLCSLKEFNVPTLKSLYRTRSRLMELRNRVYLPSQLNKSSVRCKRCFLNVLDGGASFNIQSMKLSRFARKVIVKAARKRVLTKYQTKYYEQLKKQYPDGIVDQNRLVIVCKYCKQRSTIRMLKPKKPLKLTKTQTSKRRKKKKKDKFCGLNENEVLKVASNQQTKEVVDLTESAVDLVSPKKLHPLNIRKSRIFETSDVNLFEASKKSKFKKATIVEKETPKKRTRKRKTVKEKSASEKLQLFLQNL
ncbi:uncharacterized protein LOC132696608 [Cylas formicarius]|uniref:uncharacterized protein LOC132696608 n=1 Tax=Cylas formicarius TaxID=197179 RepID=UPI002958CF7A|nr:uncharacterized protein LOC132696608 [Cylas formicarius]